MIRHRYIGLAFMFCAALLMSRVVHAQEGPCETVSTNRVLCRLHEAKYVTHVTHRSDGIVERLEAIQPMHPTASAATIAELPIFPSTSTIDTALKVIALRQEIERLQMQLTVLQWRVRDLTK